MPLCNCLQQAIPQPLKTGEGQVFVCPKRASDPTRCNFALRAVPTLGPSATSGGGQPRPLSLRFEQVAAGRFRVTASVRRDDAVAAFRECGGTFDPDTKTWLFRGDLYGDVMSRLSTLPHVRVEPLPSAVATRMMESARSAVTSMVAAAKTDVLLRGASGSAAPPPTVGGPSAATALRVPSTLMARLMPFQLSGVRFCVSKGGRAMICDEMGCGKTVTGEAPCERCVPPIRTPQHIPLPHPTMQPSRWRPTTRMRGLCW